MGKLQQLLSQSITQNMGLSDVINKRQEESNQLRQSITNAAQIQAQADITSADIYSKGLQSLGTGIESGVKTYKANEVEKKKQQLDQSNLENTQLISAVSGGLIPEATIDIGGEKKKLFSPKDKGKIEDITGLMSKGYVQVAANTPDSIPVKVGDNTFNFKYDPEQAGEVKFDEKLGLYNTKTGKVLKTTAELNIPVDKKYAFDSKLGIWNPATGEVIKPIEKLGITSPLDNKEAIEQENILRKEFNPIQLQFDSIKAAQQKLEAGIKQNSAAGDMSAIFSYMKILDPGSTVREGEFATAQNSAGIPDRIKNLYNQAASGKRLAPEQMKDFTNTSRKLFEAEQKNYNAQRTRYTNIAKRQKLETKNIVGEDYNLPDSKSFNGFTLPN